MPRIGTATLETGVIQLFFNFFCQKNHDSATVNVIPAGSLSIFYILFSLPTNSQPWQGVSKSKAKGSQIEKRIRVTAVFLPSLPAAFERADANRSRLDREMNQPQEIPKLAAALFGPIFTIYIYIIDKPLPDGL